MDHHRGTFWHWLVLVAFFGACDTFADFANGTSSKGTGGTRAAGSGAGGSSARAGGAGGTTSRATGGASGIGGSGGQASSGGRTSADGSAGTSGSGGSSGTGGGSDAGGAKAPGGNGTGGSAAGGRAGSGGAATAGGSSGTAGTPSAGGSTGAAGSAGLDCTSCHGDSTTNNPAPPQDTAGNTDTASAGVGAHAKHLALSTWHRQGKCTDCHTVPASIPHSNGKVDFNWTAPANAGNASPTFTSSLTCTGAYCHGTTLAGASTAKTTPVWNQVNEMWNACGTACHLTPPPASTGHPASTACETCHSKVIASFKAGSPPTVVWKDATLHVNGTVEVDTLTCTSCHGSGTNPAPPKDTQGNTATTAAGVGAHAQHLASSTWHRQGQCGDCHTTPTSTGHSNGTVDFAWGTPSNAAGATPSFSTSAVTCSGVYCHGAKMADQASNVIRSAVWNKVDGTQDACGKSCHATPPASSPHTAATTACQSCHAAVIASFNGASSTWKNASKHINGTVEATMNCASCHGVNGVPTLPPGDQCHSMVNGKGDVCAACHGAGTSRTVAPTSGHNDGKATYSSGSSGGVSFNAGTMTCTSSCHGAQRWGNCSGD
jgi:predicted CxxxxCH...CXXCH cytochrome family protein